MLSIISIPIWIINNYDINYSDNRGVIFLCLTDSILSNFYDLLNFQPPYLKYIPKE